MKIFRSIFLVCGAIAGVSLVAQDAVPMTTPPPPPPPAAPSSSSQVAAEPARESVPVDGLIHVQQLPTTAQLTKDAEAEGMTITRMEQSADRIVVTYRYASGNERTFAYTTVLPVDPASEIAAPRVVAAPPPTVIYRESPRVIYESYPRYVTRYYDPWPTFSIGLGFGSHFGHYGRSHYHGGYRGYHHRHRGGWRR